jgi:hypothetical protein
VAVKTRKNSSTEIVFKSKSDHARHLMSEGMLVKDVAKTLNYAFVYGIAKRANLNESLAGRRRPAGSKFTAILRHLDPKFTDAEIASILTSYFAGESSPVKITILRPERKPRTPRVKKPVEVQPVEVTPAAE